MVKSVKIKNNILSYLYTGVRLVYMKHKFSHQQRMLQKMALTPQMRQSIQLLGMSAQDLSDYIEFAMSKNPFLQKLVERPHKQSDRYSGSSIDPDDTRVTTQVADKNPRDSLISQLKLTELTEDDLKIAEYLIYEMDDNGYITIESQDAASDLSASVEDIERCIDTIQSMEPAGIGARDIGECLQIQLNRAGKADSLEYKIVSSFLAELAQEDVEKIAGALKADKNKVREALKNIRKLNPRPASNIMAKAAHEVIPELTAKIDKDKVKLEVNGYAVPRLKLYNPYENDLDIIKDPKAREFLKENMGAAKTLIDNLKRREDTLCKVADYILSAQCHTLTKDGHSLKGLSIKGVASALGFHPSTISRAVAHKYVQIGDKVIALSGLLSRGIKKANGEASSKDAILKKIRSLVKSEDTARPLSDDALTVKLKEDGMPIERRTVAKYRMKMGILPGYLRKKKTR